MIFLLSLQNINLKIIIMKKIVFQTNIDHYTNNHFPQQLSIPPRIGEHVRVKEEWGHMLKQKKLPLILEVVDVIHGEENIVCELHYKEIDLKFAKQAGRSLYN